jgi:hypothetical protein
MKPVIVLEDEDIDVRIVELLKSLTKDVFSTVTRISKGSHTIEQFNNQVVNFDEDVALGGIPRSELTSFLEHYQNDGRIASIKKLLHNDPSRVIFRNFYYYPPSTMMTWHTNSNATGTRVYYSLVCGGDIFRYRDPYTKEIIDVIAKDGWNAKQFQIGNTPEDRLWHTIYAKGPRFSFGFNIMND